MVSVVKKRSGFTLVELVVVVVIIGILAAVAAPKFFDRATDARKSAALQSLSTLRSAIEMYKADKTTYPGTLETDILSYIKGPFPAVRVGTSDVRKVKTITDDKDMTTADIASTGEIGWLYNSTRGELRINDATLFNN